VDPALLHKKTPSICLKEIPTSEAKSAEATDYFIHFCGSECYEKWKEENNKEKN